MGKEQDETLEKILDAIEKNKGPVAVKHDMIDNLSKIAVALCTAAILFVATQMQTLTTDVAVMKSQMEDFSEFSEEPRFTEAKNQAADQRLLNEIKEIVSELGEEIRENANDISTIQREQDRRQDFMNTSRATAREVDERLNKIEMKIESLKP